MIRLLQIIGMITTGMILIPVVILLTVLTLLSAALVFTLMTLTQIVILLGDIIMEKLNG